MYQKVNPLIDIHKVQGLYTYSHIPIGYCAILPHTESNIQYGVHRTGWYIASSFT